MGQGASQPESEPEELLDDAVQPRAQLEHESDQPHNNAEDEKQQQDGEASDSEQKEPQQQAAASSSASWLTRWLTPFNGSHKRRRRDSEHDDAANQPQPQQRSSAACDHQPLQHKHVKLSASSAAAASSSHSSPSHSCAECGSLRAQVADLQQQLSHTRSLSSDLTCAVCHFLFLSPVTTECGHSWCLHCMVKSLQSKRQCPLCRSAITQRPMTAAVLLTSQLQTAVNQLADVDKEERLKEQTRRSHEHIDYDVELTRLVPPASRRTRLPVYDSSDGVFRCPWCSFEVQFAASCCAEQCGPIDWSEEMSVQEWQQTVVRTRTVVRTGAGADEMDEFEEVDDWGGEDDAAGLDEDGEDDDDELEEEEEEEEEDETTEPYWHPDGSFSCMRCNDALGYAQEYCCHGRVDWTEVYRAEAEASDPNALDDEDDMDAEAAGEDEVDDDGFEAADEEVEEGEEELGEEDEVDDDGFDAAEDDAGELEWVDAADDVDEHLTDTVRLRRQIFNEAGVDTDDEEVQQLMRQRARYRVLARSNARNLRAARARRSEYDAIRARLIGADARAARQDDAAEDEAAEGAGAEVEEQLAADDAGDEDADVAELQAAVNAGDGDELVDDGEAELDFVTGSDQRIARSNSAQEEEAEQVELLLTEADLQGLYWSDDEMPENGSYLSGDEMPDDDYDGEVELYTVPA